MTLFFLIFYFRWIYVDEHYFFRVHSILKVSLYFLLQSVIVSVQCFLSLFFIICFLITLFHFQSLLVFALVRRKVDKIPIKKLLLCHKGFLPLTSFYLQVHSVGFTRTLQYLFLSKALFEGKNYFRS